MAPAEDQPQGADDLARIRATIKDCECTLWDVKFYPYVKDKDDPVICALIGKHIVHICQLTDDEVSGIRYLQTFRRKQDLWLKVHELSICTWCYVKEDEPLLAVAGESGHIQVIQAWTGELKFTLVGHGEGVVNDLATHPKYPWIIASASIDASIRIWDLRRATEPTLSDCIVICGHGLGHTEGVLSIDWHPTGWYLLSGGFDNKVCVWLLPDFSSESEFWHRISKAGRQRSSQEVFIIYYPHFRSCAVHANYIDTVKWFGDLIISKASAEQRIVIWGITGFNSLQDLPSHDDAPKTQDHLETQNGFQRTVRKYGADPHHDVFAEGSRYVEERPFERYLTLDSWNTTFIYNRFGLRLPSVLFPSIRPICSVGDDGAGRGGVSASILHWDLERQSRGYADDAELTTSEASASEPEQQSKRGRKKKQKQKVMESDSASEAQSGASSPQSSPLLEKRTITTDGTASESTSMSGFEEQQRLPNRKAWPLHKPFDPVESHDCNNTKDPKRLQYKSAAWSVCGRWFVAVGETPGGKGAYTVCEGPTQR